MLPTIFIRYSPTEVSIASSTPINKGDLLFVKRTDTANLFKRIDEIVESRPSRGVFINEANRWNMFRCKLSKDLVSQPLPPPPTE